MDSRDGGLISRNWYAKQALRLGYVQPRLLFHPCKHENYRGIGRERVVFQPRTRGPFQDWHVGNP